MRIFTAMAIVLTATSAAAYPIDSWETTGITRLEGARLVESGEVQGRKIPPGAQLGIDQIQLRLLDQPELTLPDPDLALSRDLARVLGREAKYYGIALLDLSDPDRPTFAEHRADVVFNPGSVGKILIALGLFQELADLYPDDIEARRTVLRDTIVRADSFIMTPSHEVPIWNPGDKRVARRKLSIGLEGNLWTYLDWMLSASSNAAASMTLQQVVLMKHFGRDYPAPLETMRSFLSQTDKSTLSALLIDGLQTPVTRNGLDIDKLRQGGFFTAEAKRRIPGSNSSATARDMMRLLVRMEQGRLVDDFSSLELKRLLYLTDRRIRYASSPALQDAAVFFKSGSLYKCAPEEGFTCTKYHGNVVNMMNSVAIVESPATAPRLRYMVVVNSNVLRKNSAGVHQALATAIHKMITARHPVPATEVPATEIPATEVPATEIPSEDADHPAP